MKKNTIVTMCIAIGVVGIGVAGLIIGMNLDQTSQARNIEQVPITSTSVVEDTKSQTKENDTNEDESENQTKEKEESSNQIQYDGKTILINSNSSVDASNLEISMKEAARIGLNYLKTSYSEEFDTCDISMETVIMSGIKNGSVSWSEVIEVDNERRYELSVDAQTGEVLDSASYYKVDGDSQEWVKAEGNAKNRTVKVEKLNIEAFTKIDVDMNYSADVEIVKGNSYGVVLNYRTDNYKMEYENKDGKLQISDKILKQTENINSNITARNYVTIIVPKDAKFSTITIKTTSGDIAVKDINTESLTTLAYSGDSTFGSITAKKIESESYSGDINVKNVQTDGMKLNALSGDIIIEGNVNGKTICDAVSGDIEITCKSKENQYSYDLNSVSGCIQVGNRVEDDGPTVSVKSSKSKENHIEATTTSGDITIEFGE